MSVCRARRAFRRDPHLSFAAVLDGELDQLRLAVDFELALQIQPMRFDGPHR
jgi:hypothetical protein